MELRKSHWIGMFVGIIIIGISFLFYNQGFFFFIIGMGFLIAATPFVIGTIRETSIVNEKEEMFLEFTRNLLKDAEAAEEVWPLKKEFLLRMENLSSKGNPVL